MTTKLIDSQRCGYKNVHRCEIYFIVHKVNKEPSAWMGLWFMWHGELQVPTFIVCEAILGAKQIEIQTKQEKAFLRLIM